LHVATNAHLLFLDARARVAILAGSARWSMGPKIERVVRA